MPERLWGGITSCCVETPRLRTHLLDRGPKDVTLHPITGMPMQGIPVLFIHGNISSCRFFEETLMALNAPRYRGLAPDLRGFGDSEAKPVDATQGLRDFSEDLYALVKQLGYAGQKVHLVGWSIGGGVAMQYAIDRPVEVASVTLINPISPCGMGGIKDTVGTPCWEDYAGSGAGFAHPNFVELLSNRDRSANHQRSPRNVLNGLYFKPPFRATAEREEVFLSSMLSTVVGSKNYPGSWEPSENWPNYAPGETGLLNAIAPKYCEDLKEFAKIEPKPPVLWIRGAHDQVISNASPIDDGRLGRLGGKPGNSKEGSKWPGEKTYPPQPMISQTYALLDHYWQLGGSYREVVLDCGHTPHVERPEAFRQALFEGFLDRDDLFHF